MFKMLKKDFKTGIVTTKYPYVPDVPPDGFRGKPEIDFNKCTTACAEVCPSKAITIDDDKKKGIRTLNLSYAKCVFCGRCEEACPDAIKLGKDFELASKNKDNLLVTATFPKVGAYCDTPLQKRLADRIKNIFGRSLHIREVDAGSCNGCEWELTALTNPIYDVSRFGIDFVASPRHADMLAVTGPVTRHMEIPLIKTYHATPEPKIVMAIGTCACSGGVFQESYATLDGVDKVLPVNVYVPGCPPRPQALIYGLLLALDRIRV